MPIPVAQERLMTTIERLRDQEGLTRRALAAKLHRTHQWLDAIVAGRSRISVDDANALAEAFGAHVEIVADTRTLPQTAIRLALDADRDLSREWREAIWAVYKRAKADGHRPPGKRVIGGIGVRRSSSR
jgi:transcriptional regulator with XRE-family HTH domain